MFGFAQKFRILNLGTFGLFLVFLVVVLVAGFVFVQREQSDRSDRSDQSESTRARPPANQMAAHPTLGPFSDHWDQRVDTKIIDGLISPAVPTTRLVSILQQDQSAPLSEWESQADTLLHDTRDWVEHDLFPKRHVHGALQGYNVYVNFSPERNVMYFTTQLSYLITSGGESSDQELRNALNQKIAGSVTISPYLMGSCQPDSTTEDRN